MRAKDKKKFLNFCFKTTISWDGTRLFSAVIAWEDAAKV